MTSRDIDRRCCDCNSYLFSEDASGPAAPYRRIICLSCRNRLLLDGKVLPSALVWCPATRELKESDELAAANPLEGLIASGEVHVRDKDFRVHGAKVRTATEADVEKAITKKRHRVRTPQRDHIAEAAGVITTPQVRALGRGDPWKIIPDAPEDWTALRQLRLWHWEGLLVCRQSQAEYADQEHLVKRYELAAAMHMKAVQALNDVCSPDFYPNRGAFVTAEADYTELQRIRRGV